MKSTLLVLALSFAGVSAMAQGTEAAAPAKPAATSKKQAAKAACEGKTGKEFKKCVRAEMKKK